MIVYCSIHTRYTTV